MTDAKIPKISNFVNLTGQRFGRLVVVKYIGTIARKVAWECLCDCGKTKITFTQYLKTGDTKSCGCLSRQLSGSRFTTHGKRNAPEYAV